MNAEKGFTLKKVTILTFAAALLALPSRAAEQVITPSPAATIAPGSTLVSVDVNYRTANPQNPNLTGLGLRLHFDSTRLNFISVGSVFPPGFVSLNPQADTSNFDGDPATDRYILVSWADIAGHWPGSEPQKLYTATFSTVAAFSGITFLRFSASSTAAGYVLSSTPWRVSSNALGLADFNLDGRSDILWRRPSTGETSIWLMNGGVFTGIVLPGAVPSTWAPKSIGDFDGDGRGDIFWHNGSTGETSVWMGWNGSTFVTQIRSLTAPVAWAPVGGGDIDCDGRSDIFWRNGSTGQTSIWFMNGTPSPGTAVTTTVPTTWNVTAVADFDGDCRSDLFWRNASTGETSAWLEFNGTGFGVQARSTTVPAPWLPSGTGDINGDFKSDIFWNNPSTGETSIWFMNGAVFSSAIRATTVPPPWTPAVFRDFDGDGKSDIFWRSPSTGETSIWLGWNGTNFATQVRSATVPTVWAPAP